MTLQLYHLIDLKIKSGDVDWMARQEAKFSKRGINIDTINEYGLDIHDFPKIKESIDKYFIKSKSSVTNSESVLNVNWERFSLEEPEVFDKIRDFVIHSQNEVIAPSTLGNTYKLLADSVVAKIIFQFMSYPLQSLNKKIRHKFRSGNNVPAYLMFGALGGALSYFSSTLVSSLSKEDPEDYLSEKMRMSNIMGGSFSKSVYSWFFPLILGNLQELITDENSFGSLARSGSGSSKLLGNPTFDLIDNVYRLGQQGSNYLGSGDEEDLRKATKTALGLMPVAAGNMITLGLQTGAQKALNN